MNDINELNKRFGSTGRIAFRVAESGIPVVILVSNYGSCEVSLYGGQVLSYRPTGHVPVLFKSREATQPEGLPTRGGAQLCWPWFGAPPSPALPRDGFAGRVQWNVLSTGYDSKSTEVSLYLTDTDETRTFWPHSFELVQKITLSDSLSIEVTTLNNGSEPFQLSQSIHPYFKVRDIEKISISGVEGCEFTDLLTGESHIQDGILTIDKEICRSYTSKQSACVISDTGLGRAIAMTYSGMQKLIVGNPWVENSRQQGELVDAECQGILSIAPATTPEEKAVLKPGEKIAIQTSFQATLT